MHQVIYKSCKVIQRISISVSIEADPIQQRAITICVSLVMDAYILNRIGVTFPTCFCDLVYAHSNVHILITLLEAQLFHINVLM